ncbi:hypothetical protein Droror1_Dr00015903 [Drosera rotundifolia]
MKNLVPGEAVYNEKRISVQNEDGTKVEYRIWNPFRSKLAAAVLGGVDHICILELLLAPRFHMFPTLLGLTPDQARILALNASYFLNTGGHGLMKQGYYPLIEALAKDIDVKLNHRVTKLSYGHDKEKRPVLY